MYREHVDFSSLVGKTIKEIVGGVGDEIILFLTDDGMRYEMFHSQDCCENVYIESIDGNLHALCGHVVLQAEESSNSDDPKADEYDESHTWTFYRIATAGGYATIRWYGTSNGYYSETADFCLVNENR